MLCISQKCKKQMKRLSNVLTYEYLVQIVKSCKKTICCACRKNERRRRRRVLRIFSFSSSFTTFVEISSYCESLSQNEYSIFNAFSSQDYSPQSYSAMLCMSQKCKKQMKRLSNVLTYEYLVQSVKSCKKTMCCACRKNVRR